MDLYVSEQANLGLELFVAVLAVAGRLQGVVVRFVSLFLVWGAQQRGAKVALVRLFALGNQKNACKILGQGVSLTRLTAGWLF